MATLDNAIWFGTDGFAEDGSTVLSEGGNTTTVSATFTADAWDATAGGTNISDFGAAFLTAPITADYQFSNPVENLSFDINHVNDDGASTYDDEWTISALDEDGNPIPAADIIASLSGLVDETVVDNGDGTVSIIANGTVANDVSINLAGPVSSLSLVYDQGPGGTQSGGSGISDLTFDIPPNDTDGDGVSDANDLDSDNDGILDTDEGYSVTDPTTITITFDGDEWTTVDNTRWELYDADGNLIASDTTVGSGVEVTNVDITGLTLGEFQFIIYDDFGDGLGGTDPASYTVAVDGVVVVDSGPNPGGFSTQTENFTVAQTITTTDTDGDGIADHLDLDSDNDGITDNVEAQSTAGYVAPTGTDTDGDGVDDAYDSTPTTGAAGSNGLTPVDTDSDGTADYIDTDSDNDGTNDVDEAGHGVSQAAIDASGDSDGDGIKDVVDDVVGADVNDNDVNGSGDFTLADTDGDTPADGTGAVPMLSDLDFRDAADTEAIYDAIQLTGLPGDTDLLISGSEMTQVDEALEFSTQTPGQLSVGDTVNIGGTIYAISALHDYEADLVNDNGATSETVSGHIIELDDGNGGTLTFMMVDDSYGPKPDITEAQLLFVDPAAANPPVTAYDTDQDVSLSGLNFIVEGTGGADTIDASYLGDPEGDRIDNNDHHDGSNDDSITAGGGADVVTSGAGNDTIDGGTGADTISAGSGNDSVVGGANDDVLDGGSGDDTIEGGDGNDMITTSTGSDLALGGDGDDFISGAGDDATSNDTMDGGAGDDTLIGGQGDDSLIGGAGNDVIVAAEGDTAIGGDGDDIFYTADYGEAGAGTINITGGEGAETDGDTLYLGSDVSYSDITFTNTDDAAGGLSGNFTLADGTVVNFTEIENIICFTPGTMILTETGERPIDSLRPCDRVITRDHGAQPLRWVGRSTVPGRGKFAPVRVSADLLEGARRSLLVSPQHRFVFGGYQSELYFGESEVMAAATHLEDGVHAWRTPCDMVTYIHLVFDAHEVIYAEGTATESFHAGNMAMSAITGAVREDLFRAFPELRSDAGAHGPTARYCLKAHEARLLLPEPDDLLLAA